MFITSHVPILSCSRMGTVKALKYKYNRNKND